MMQFNLFSPKAREVACTKPSSQSDSKPSPQNRKCSDQVINKLFPFQGDKITLTKLCTCTYFISNALVIVIAKNPKP